MLILLCCVSLCMGNFWDNMYSNMNAPHVVISPYPSFEAIFSTNSSLNITNYVAVDADRNMLHLLTNSSFLDFNPKTLFDIIINFNTKEILYKNNTEQCFNLTLAEGGATFRFAAIFNMLPLLTYYNGAVDDG